MSTSIVKGFNKKVYRTVEIEVSEQGLCRASYSETQFVPGVDMTIQTAVNGVTITSYNEGEGPKQFVATSQYDMNNIIEKLVQRPVTQYREFRSDEYDEDVLDKLRDAGAVGIPYKAPETTA